jgi:hypothetical protein
MCTCRVHVWLDKRMREEGRTVEGMMTSGPSRGALPDWYLSSLDSVPMSIPATHTKTRPRYLIEQ